ncbi:hypothetical protein E3U43_013625, partial [Larimichthys crocea]
VSEPVEKGEELRCPGRRATCTKKGFLIDNIPTVIASSHFSRFQDLAVSIPTSDDVHVHVSRGSEPAL